MKTRARSRRFPLIVEACEARRLLTAHLLVTTAGDNGDDAAPLPGSLREAILKANAEVPAPGDRNTIGFAIDGPATIRPSTPLPVVKNPTILDALAAPSPVVLSGSLLESPGDGGSGLVFRGDRSGVIGLTVDRFPGNGIVFDNVRGGLVLDARIGVDPSGMNRTGPVLDPLGNLEHGILLRDASQVTIQDCVISGNGGSGILLRGAQSYADRIVGNVIGTSLDGLRALPSVANGQSASVFDGSFNGNGVSLDNAPANTIGGAGSSLANLIAGNRGIGVEIRGVGSLNNQVAGNRIGLGSVVVVNFQKSTALGNGSGVYVGGEAHDNTIGGTVDGAGNVISGNLDGGVDLSGPANTVASNTIVSNGSGGVVVANPYQNPLVESRDAILGNLIGTDARGSAGLGNHSDGIAIYDSDEVLVQDNVVAASETGTGIDVYYSDRVDIVGNRVGTDRSGLRDLGNFDDAIRVAQTSNVSVVGNTLVGSRTGYGLNLSTAGVTRQTTGQVIERNQIGVNRTGTGALPNAKGGIVAIGYVNNYYDPINKLLIRGNVISGNDGAAQPWTGCPGWWSGTTSSAPTRQGRSPAQPGRGPLRRQRESRPGGRQPGLGEYFDRPDARRIERLHHRRNLVGLAHTPGTHDGAVPLGEFRGRGEGGREVHRDGPREHHLRQPRRRRFGRLRAQHGRLFRILPPIRRLPRRRQPDRHRPVRSTGEGERRRGPFRQCDLGHDRPGQPDRGQQRGRHRGDRLDFPEHPRQCDRPRHRRFGDGESRQRRRRHPLRENHLAHHLRQRHRGQPPRRDRTRCRRPLRIHEHADQLQLDRHHVHQPGRSDTPPGWGTSGMGSRSRGPRGSRSWGTSSTPTGSTGSRRSPRGSGASASRFGGISSAPRPATPPTSATAGTGSGSTGSGPHRSPANAIGSNGGNGITLKDATGVNATGNAIGTDADGRASVLGNRGDGVLILGDSADEYLTGDTIFNNLGHGVEVQGRVRGLTLSGDQVGGSLRVVGSSKLVPAGNAKDGILIAATAPSSGIYVSLSLIAGNGSNGVELLGAGPVVLGSYNTISGNRGNGVRLGPGATGNTLGLDLIADNLGDGVRFDQSSNNVLTGVVLRNNRGKGLRLNQATGIVVHGGQNIGNVLG